MLKKAILSIVVVVLLAGIVNSATQEKKGEVVGKQIQEQRRDVSTTEEGIRSRQSRLMGEGFDKWLNELTEAYQQQDREKMGQLLEEMKKNRERRREAPSDRRRDRQGGGVDRSSTDSSPIPKTEAEKKILGILDDILATQRFRNVPPQDGRFLRITTESMNAKNVVEIGTSTGYSGIWFGMALQKTGGKLTTFEIDAQRAATARANFKRAGMADIITLVEGDAHDEVKKLKGKIDILFLDADKEGYVDYLNKLLPLVRPGGLVIAHNINPRQADPKYMEAITTNPSLETIVRSGVGITLKKR
jgi:predicted O-methyltransferase YrrM